MTSEISILDEHIINDADRIKEPTADSTIDQLRAYVETDPETSETDDDDGFIDDDNDPTTKEVERLPSVNDMSELSKITSYEFFKEIPFVKIITERIIFTYCHFMLFLISFLNNFLSVVKIRINGDRFYKFVADDLDFYKGSVSMLLFQKREKLNLDQPDDVKNQLAIKSSLDLLASIEFINDTSEIPIQNN